MPEDLRQDLLRLVDGDPRVLPLAHQIFNSPYRRPMVQWLLAARLTGAQFMGWFKVECQGSPMYLLKVLEAKVLRKSKPRLVQA